MSYLVLDQFRRLFEGGRYRHRDSSLGDSVARRLPEDLYALNRSPRLNSLIDSGLKVMNLQNSLRGIKSRRGDTTFGEVVPRTQILKEPGFAVRRGDLATVEIGVEVKILAKAMIKQIDRVVSDLVGQVQHFRRAGGTPICVGIACVNYADRCTSYEGAREYPTDGRENRHPIQESAEAERHLLQRAAPAYDEFIILRFRSRNEPPFIFEWVDEQKTVFDYGAVLIRTLRKYEDRFF